MTTPTLNTCREFNDYSISLCNGQTLTYHTPEGKTGAYMHRASQKWLTVASDIETLTGSRRSGAYKAAIDAHEQCAGLALQHGGETLMESMGL